MLLFYSNLLSCFSVLNHSFLEKFPTFKITREGKSSTWSGPQRARPAEAAGGLNMIGVIWLKRKS